MHRINFETVKTEFQHIFPSARVDSWDLIPDSIHELAASEGIALHWEKISNWQQFEKGQIDFDEEDFLDIAFHKHKPEGRMYVITDNCFESREAYCIDSNELLDFIRNIDQFHNEVSFVQPSDFVFINPAQKLVTLIHHEGLVTQYMR